MKKIICTFGLLVGIATLIGGCKKDDDQPQPGNSDNSGGSNNPEWTVISQYVKRDANGIYYVSDLPGNAKSTGGTPVLFSFVTHDLVDSTKMLTDEWDVYFDKFYNSFVTANDPTKMDPPGPDGVGRGGLVVVMQPFDEVTEAPSDEAFAASESYAAWDGFPASHIGWYTYDLEAHVMRPLVGRTLVVRTAKGKYAKIEMISMYKGNPENPTSSSPAPYISFRYWVQEDGSKNLKTK